MQIKGWKRAFVGGVVALALVAAYGCGDDDSGSGTTTAVDGGSDAATTSDTGTTPGDSGAQDSGADTGTPLTCDDKPDSGVNPTCGSVGPCGELVSVTTDAANDLPTGTGTTLPTGTYVLVAAKLYKLAYNVQIKSTVRFASDGTFQSIESVTLNGMPSDIDERKSGTYVVAGGVLTLTETCPSSDVDDPTTFNVSAAGAGSVVTFFTPQVGTPGAGVEQTYAVIP